MLDGAFLGCFSYPEPPCRGASGCQNVSEVKTVAKSEKDSSMLSVPHPNTPSIHRNISKHLWRKAVETRHDHRLFIKQP